MSRKRRENGVELSVKGGVHQQRRPKFSQKRDGLEEIWKVKARIENEFHNSLINTGFFFSIVDMVSYAANVKRMLEIFGESRVITSAVVTLWKATFPGRRRQMLKEELSSIIMEVVEQTCPVLKHMSFVSSFYLVFLYILFHFT